MFMEFWECLDHLTVCMFIGKIVLLLFQGSYEASEKYATIVLEAVADNNLGFWHAAFGFPGTCNDINILDVSPLHTCFLHTIILETKNKQSILCLELQLNTVFSIRTALKVCCASFSVSTQSNVALHEVVALTT